MFIWLESHFDFLYCSVCIRIRIEIIEKDPSPGSKRLNFKIKRLHKILQSVNKYNSLEKAFELIIFFCFTFQVSLASMGFNEYRNYCSFCNCLGSIQFNEVTQAIFFHSLSFHSFSSSLLDITKGLISISIYE